MPHTLAEYRAEYEKADALCQEVQNFRNEAGVPAINELRNAGHHLLNALDATGAVINQGHLDAAMAHVRRASYEATEAGIMMAIAQVHDFQRDYRAVEISDLLSDYTGRCRECQEAVRLIEQGRQPGFNRDQDHVARIEVFRKIRPFAEELQLARPEALKRIEQKRTEARRFIIGTLLAVMGILVALIALDFSSIYNRVTAPFKQQAVGDKAANNGNN